MCALLTNNLSGTSRESPALRLYSPVIKTDQLIPGVDNIRFDAALSPRFVLVSHGLMLKLIVKHSEAAQILHKSPGPPKPSDKKEFKDLLQDVLVNALNRGKAQRNPQLELLAQATILKFLLMEAQARYNDVVAEGREKLKLFLHPGQENNPRGHHLRDLISDFQKNKKIIFRRAGHELLELIQEVRLDPVRKIRESYFGPEASEPQAIFSNALLFTDDGKNEYVNLEKYVMLGNFQKDPDRFELVEQEVRSFLEWADRDSAEARAYHAREGACANLNAQIEELRKRLEEPAAKRGFFSRSGRTQEGPSPQDLRRAISSLEAKLRQEMEKFRPVAETYAARLDQLISAPENATLLVDVLQTERQISEARRANAPQPQLARLESRAVAQSEALDRLYHAFQETGLVAYILAAYQTAKIYHDFCPPLNPQQLKEALVDAGARQKLILLMRAYRLPEETETKLEETAAAVRDASPREIRAQLIRFLRDYMRYRQDSRNLGLLQGLLNQIHFPMDAKQRELSQINHTLYEFLLPEEETRPKKGKTSGHVIMKADIRDSTSITEELSARELNPASYFSLNFFDPVHKLLPKYGASKVFLEGDAIILSILETDGDPSSANSVARACCLAREIVEGVRAVNDRAAQKKLPPIELGIGICYQASAPMYLMDGERPVMISKAINQSDRLSGCGKLARQLLAGKNRFFNVFLMQLLPDAESAASEEFLLHYNVEGIEINSAAFEKLCQELSMSKLELKFPLFGEPEAVELYSGTLPLGESFQKLVVRKGRVPHIHPKDLRVVEYTDRYYYEVCSGKPLYEYVGRQLGW